MMMASAAMVALWGLRREKLLLEYHGRSRGGNYGRRGRWGEEGFRRTELWESSYG